MPLQQISQACSFWHTQSIQPASEQHDADHDQERSQDYGLEQEKEECQPIRLEPGYVLEATSDASYRVQRKMAQGGFASVYLARRVLQAGVRLVSDEDQEVAIKVGKDMGKRC